VLASALLLAACGQSGEADVVDVGQDSDQDPTVQLPDSGEPTPPFAEFVGGDVAGLGDALVVLGTERVSFAPTEDHTPQPVEQVVGAAVRLSDGTWVELPEPPKLWNADVVDVGGTVGIVGVECGSETCETFVPRAALLASDLGSWQELDLGGRSFPASADSGMVAIGGGFFTGPDGYYAVDASGLVHSFAAPQEASGSNMRFLRCRVGSNQLVWVELQYGEETVREIEEPSDVEDAPTVEATPEEQIRATVTRVVVFDRSRPDAGWAPAALPDGTDLDRPALLCGSTGPILATPSTEFSYNEGRWNQQAIQLPPELQARIARDAAEGQPLDDGTVLIRVPGGFDPDAEEFTPLPDPVVLRYTDGRYVPTEPPPGPLSVIDGKAYTTTEGRTDQIARVEFD
jgi:hypothetical protein